MGFGYAYDLVKGAPRPLERAAPGPESRDDGTQLEGLQGTKG